jgi:tetratricopeptide (TPR) repeat protein/transcriptional regulator with XRE-family HTH domain
VTVRPGAGDWAMSSGPGPEALGSWLRRARLAAPMTLEELAGRSGVSVRAISDLERGRTRKPYPRTVRLVTAALGLPDGADGELVPPTGDPDRPPGSVPGAAPAGPIGQSGRVVPRQLPPQGTFVGRAGELAALTRHLDEAGGQTPGMVVISAIGGTAGVGKTALAMRWAHQVAALFDDGQLYVNLRGFAPGAAATAPAEALRGFLDALGVAAERIPPGLDARAGLFRSLLAGKKMLIVVDNARDERQVRPLLPASPGCLVLVTSRRQLAGLAAVDGARLLGLDLPSHAEARQMLASRLGGERAAAEPGAVDQIVSLCARLPLALTVAAARASTRPRFSLTALVGELSDIASRLDALDTGDPAASLRAVFSWSCQQLSPAAACMFRLLSRHPGPDITAPAAASLTAAGRPAAARALRELTAVSLLTEHPPGRYAFHDLLRAYATELAQATDDERARQAATGRVRDHYLHTATAASQLHNPYRELEPMSGPQPGARPEEMTSLPQALDWFQAERQVLAAAISQAAADGSDIHAWQLAWAIAPFLNGQGFWHELEATQQIALAAARRLGNLTAQAHAHHFLGSAALSLGAPRKAEEHLTTALNIEQQAGARSLQAREHNTLVDACIQQGRFREALSHARQALRLCRALEHQYGQAHSLNSVGWCHAQLGSFAEALTCCQEALAIYRDLRPRSLRGEAVTLDSLGYAHHHLGNHAQAITCHQQAIDLLADTGNPDDLAGFLTHLGDAYHSADDHEAARRAWQQGLATLDDLQHPARTQLRSRLDHISASRGSDAAERHMP